MIDIPGVEDDWWSQRVAFLASRADAHLEERSDWLRHRACAATLLRDAGCVLLLREEFEAGGKYLVRAGEQLLGLGLAAGLPLIGLFDVKRGQEQATRYRQRVNAGGPEAASRQSEMPVDSPEAIAFAARGSFRSMVSLVQAEQLGATADRTTEGEGKQREARREELITLHGFREMGITGLSVARYVGVCDWMERARASRGADDIPVDVHRAIQLLGRYREANVEAARSDKFRWQLVARPAELLDLDSVVLMRLALGAGYSQKDMVNRLGWERGDVVGAPLDVAAALTRFGRDHEPGPSL